MDAGIADAETKARSPALYGTGSGLAKIAARHRFPMIIEPEGMDRHVRNRIHRSAEDE